jgi:DHA2 family multidrug resistance protein
LVSHLTPFDARYNAALAGASQMLMTHGSNATQAASQAQGLLYGTLQRQATMLAFLDDFWLMALLALAMIPLMFLMKKTKPQKAASVTTD